MFFVTNRALKQSKRSRINREVSFDLNDNEPSASVFFCERTETDDPIDSYTEIGSRALLERLKRDPAGCWRPSSSSAASDGCRRRQSVPPSAKSPSGAGMPAMSSTRHLSATELSFGGVKFG